VLAGDSMIELLSRPTNRIRPLAVRRPIPTPLPSVRGVAFSHGVRAYGVRRYGSAVRRGVTLILDSGGLTALAGQRARLAELRRRGLRPAQVPSVVLTEALTGDHHRDFQTSGILRACQVCDVGELVARTAARMRAAIGRAGSISVVDAVVAAHAARCPEPLVLTSDHDDVTALAETAPRPIGVVRV